MPCQSGKGSSHIGCVPNLYIIYTFDLDIGEVRVYTEGQVARQRPRSGRPGDDADRGVLVEGKGHNHCMEQQTKVTYMYDEFQRVFLYTAGFI